ncbi:MAG TPA: transcription antitermination factor NusB, partial [Pseudomonas sp.]|nr:transcription antitermination factor NusB [Pseudomonas sp.]
MNPRLAAARALASVLAGKASLGSSLPPLLDKVEARDRGLAQDLAFGTARWQPRLALIAEKLLQKPFKAADRDVEALLLIGLYQLFYTRIPAHAAIGETVACVDKLKKPSLKGLLNAVLRNAQRDGESIIASLERDPVLHSAHPRWLQKRLKAEWPEHWQAICAANNAHPPLILRVNRRHGNRDDYLAELRRV